MSKVKKNQYKNSKKLGKIYHVESGLVIKSLDEKVVIGRIDDDKFVPLDETALKLCEEYDMQYDTSLVETEASEEEEEDVASDDETEEEQPEAKKSKSPEKKTAKTSKTTSVSSENPKLRELLDRFATELQSVLQPSDDSSSRVAELESQVEQLKKELAQSKTKLKTVLAALS